MSFEKFWGVKIFFLVFSPSFKKKKIEKNFYQPRPAHDQAKKKLNIKKKPGSFHSARTASASSSVSNTSTSTSSMSLAISINSGPIFFFQNNFLSFFWVLFFGVGDLSFLSFIFRVRDLSFLSLFLGLIIFFWVLFLGLGIYLFLSFIFGVDYLFLSFIFGFGDLSFLSFIFGVEIYLFCVYFRVDYLFLSFICLGRYLSFWVEDLSFSLYFWVGDLSFSV